MHWHFQNPDGQKGENVIEGQTDHYAATSSPASDWIELVIGFRLHCYSRLNIPLFVFVIDCVLTRKNVYWDSERIKVIDDHSEESGG